MENNMELIRISTSKNGNQVVSDIIDKYGFVSEVDFTLHKFMESKV